MQLATQSTNEYPPCTLHIVPRCSAQASSTDHLPAAAGVEARRRPVWSSERVRRGLRVPVIRRTSDVEVGYRISDNVITGADRCRQTSGRSAGLTDGRKEGRNGTERMVSESDNCMMAEIAEALHGRRRNSMFIVARRLAIDLG